MWFSTWAQTSGENCCHSIQGKIVGGGWFLETFNLSAELQRRHIPENCNLNAHTYLQLHPVSLRTSATKQKLWEKPYEPTSFPRISSYRESVESILSLSTVLLYGEEEFY
jgi:hypothetical protein